MAKKKQKTSWTDWCFWYCTFIAIFFTICAALPPIPWRYARVDTNVGNRFVSDRRYGLMSCSNQFGQNQMWFSLRTKMQRKTEEFGRPSPLTALAGVGATATGVGGAAMGCIMWIACKEHVANRYIQYGTIAIVGVLTFLALGFSALCSLTSLAMMQFEGDGKKKKKKKDDVDIEPVTKTLIAAMIAWLCVVIGTGSFYMCLDMMLKAFKTQAYYPYAASYMGFFLACFAIFLHCNIVCCAISRKYKCCSGSKKKKKDDDYGADYGNWGGDYGAGGYGKGKW